MTNKELVEKYISEMNPDNLKKVLSDKYTYNTHFDKDHIVDVLEEEVFITFKEKGDTFLKPFTGSCQSDCCKNKKCKGIAFVGNYSNDVINIVFEENNDEYIDIFSCSNFKTIENIKTNAQHWIPTLSDDPDEPPF